MSDENLVSHSSETTKEAEILVRLTRLNHVWFRGFRRQETTRIYQL